MSWTRPRAYGCPDCAAGVIRARTEAMSWQLLNVEPDPAGNVHAYSDGRGNWFARSVPPGTPAVLPDRLMMPHFATSPACREKALARRQPRRQPVATQLPPNVTPITSARSWRGALRERRGSR